MKHNCIFHAGKSILLILMLIILNNAVMAQVPPDTTKPKVDTTAVMKTDTTNHAPAAVAATAAATGESAPKEKHFSIYGGANSNTMSGSTDKYNSNAGVGWHVGVAWSKGSFLYWQAGLRFNEAVYGFNSKITNIDTGNLQVQALDIPLTFGINFLSFAKIISLRAFISAIPSFTLGVSDNHFGISKDNVNSFIFYGQFGIGASIGPGFIDIGYNYGTTGLLKNTSGTNPGQAYLSIGLRF